MYKKVEFQKYSTLKVVILWGVVGVTFLSFWILHEHISAYQEFVNPENYIMRGKYYLESDDLTKARKEIEEGMEIFKPINPEAYLILKYISQKENKMENLDWIEKQYKVSKLLQDCYIGKNGELYFNINTLNSNDFIPSDLLTRSTSVAIRSIWKTLSSHAWKCLQNYNLTDSQILTFLNYAGGVLNFSSQIGTTGVSIDEDILILSEGSPEGKGAQIWYQGKNYGGNRRGFYVLILYPTQTHVYRADRFDIWESRNEALKMEQFLSEVPEGYIGAFAVSDEASENMTEQLEQCLLSFGFSKRTYVQREKKIFGYGYAFCGIGVKGANEGSALQNWAKYDPSRKMIPVSIVAVIKRGKEK